MRLSLEWQNINTCGLKTQSPPANKAKLHFQLFNVCVKQSVP